MPRPRYLPFEPGPHRHKVGTRTLDPAAWIELGPDTDAQLVEKRRVLDVHHDDAFAVLTGPPGPGEDAVRAASAELLEVLSAHLVATFPDRYAAVPPAAGLHPLELAARLVPEDLCLHLPGDDGVLRLVAACVAFPSRWSLREKLGQAVGEIHSPVPGYDPAIRGPVDQLLDRLPPGRVLWRLNGSLLDDPALFQPAGPARHRGVRVPEGVVLRTERQTLRRLPRTGAVVFTIRTFVDPLAVLADDPAACAQVAGWLRGLPGATAGYKGLEHSGPAVLEWLDERAVHPIG
ncbi:uncharacterized protein DUF3445 [Motilibacter peucedani]|uniref:Uncharacterized protein DUF3445 n=1 Tax=Motilibacter peucedani TaxID=598650 RepID=A0A420XN36_9ACTN|nr:DUF3445 domain-containing protein [Motilibacter peucedani]RKS72698.1 uncharacterized protein DUF3445 [Motilibacter peucedani]